MPRSTRLPKSPEPANWLEHQLTNALAGRPFSPQSEREAVHLAAAIARAKACRAICTATEDPMDDPRGFIVASITTQAIDSAEQDEIPETESTVDDATCVLANAGLLTKTTEPNGVAWRLGTVSRPALNADGTPGTPVTSALADPKLADHDTAGWAGGLAPLPEILALGAAYFDAFIQTNEASMNIHQSEIHAQKRFVIDRSKHRDLCEILDRCGYLGRYDDATAVAA
jgi:hypothetical protein